MKPARAVKAWHTIYPNPLTFRAGEALTLGKRDTEWSGWVWCTNAAGQSGWAPEAYAGVARRDYTARELELHEGETVTLLDEESGWFWAQAADGRTGWVPATHVAAAEPRLRR
jgi:uncharacterized protein YgiM (DUF1202 family)